MKLIIDTDKDEDAKDTMQWVLDEYKCKSLINQLTHHLAKKYKYENPKGDGKEQAARVQELEEISKEFWEMVNDNNMGREWIY